MGTPITGREILIGLKKAATWGTAVVCGANDGILITSESLSQKIEELLDDSVGLAFIQRTDQGKIDVAGNIEAYLRYEGLDVALALIMGTAGTPSQQGESDAYTNSYVIADAMTGLFATVAIKKKSDKAWEFTSVKLHGFTLAAEMNLPAKLTLNAIADQLTLASEANTTTTLADLTYPDKGNRIIMNADTTVEINDESGDAVDADDKVYPNSIELAFNRPAEGDHLPGSNYINEPADNDFPEPILTLNFPRYNDANHGFFEDWIADTRKKGEIYFKGAQIESTYYYEMKITMPNMKLIDPEAAIAGAGKIPSTLKFRLLGTDTAPTGMTGITKPFQIDIQNKRTTDPLG